MENLQRLLIGAGVISVLIVVCNANNEDTTLEQIYDMAQNIYNATNRWQNELKDYSVEGRKSKFFPFGLLPFHALCEFDFLF